MREIQVKIGRELCMDQAALMRQVAMIAIGTGHPEPFPVYGDAYDWQIDQMADWRATLRGDCTLIVAFRLGDQIEPQMEALRVWLQWQLG